jgi:hypothetical protein
MHAGGSTVGALSIDDGELGCGGGDMDGGGGCAVSGSRFVRCAAAVGGTLISVPDAAAAGGALISVLGVAAVGGAPSPCPVQQ